jgi:hypothetical protein
MGLAKELLLKAEQADKVHHQLTKGELKETAIKDALRDIIPSGYEICSGFVADSFGKVSPQLDIIIYEKNAVPSLFLNKDKAVIPIESFKMAIEIKSTLRLEDQKQLEEQFESLNSMKNVSFLPAQNLGENSTTIVSKKGIPSIFVICFDNKIGKKTLCDYISKYPFITGVHVLSQANHRLKTGGLICAL